MKRIIVLILGLAVAIGASARSGDKDKEEVEPFDRGIGGFGKTTNVFIPKGTIGAGASLSYANYSIGNGYDDAGYSLLLNLVQNTTADLQTISIAPHVSYFITDNISLGLKFKYGKTSCTIDNANISLGDDLNFDIEDVNYLKHSWEGGFIFRDYIPFGQSKRFAMFAEVGITGSYSQSKDYDVGYDETLQMAYKEGTYTDIYGFDIGLTPGLIAFLSNEVALEVSVGVFGFNYSKATQTTNQVEKSVMENSTASFKINILSIGIGISFYLPTRGGGIKSSK